MIHLPETFKKNGYFYFMLSRGDNAVIYEQSAREDCVFMKDVCGYEVFEIRIQKESTRTIMGQDITYPEKERLPSDESFGYWAWTFRTWETAIKKFNELELNQIEK